MVRESGAVTVIDLGVLPSEEPGEPPARIDLLLWGRRLAAVVTAAAVLAGVTAAAPLPRHRLSTLAVLPSSAGVARVVDAGLVMVFENQRAVAYDPDGWRELWSVQGSAFVHAVAYQDLVLLFRGDAMNEPAAQRAEWARAVDRATGLLRWSSDRQVELQGDVMTVYVVADLEQRVEFRDPRTNELRWRLPSSLTWVSDERRSALWRIAPDGALVEHDLLTGAVRRTERVRLPGKGENLNLRVARGALGIASFGERGYSETTLWYDTTSLAGISGVGQWSWEHDCGRGLHCAYSLDGERVYLVDPATGAVIRSVADGRAFGSPLGLLVVGPQDSGASFSLPTVGAVLDPSTGVQRADLKGWRVLGMDDSIVRVLAHYDVPHKLTYLAELTDREAVRLGPVPHLLRECTTAGRALVCATMAGDIVVLRIERDRP
ncbi:hypothetical protein [Catellatospora methionotrophica]|uniref:hypothetical protein n=1 Tax=Catellatospora methionotrophica TaxID=121620 RepID=UPI003402181A